MLLLMSSCSTFPLNLFFPAACSGVTILFLYIWSIRHWLVQLLWSLYVTLSHAMGRQLLAMCVFLCSNNLRVALSHIGCGESKGIYWLNKTDLVGWLNFDNSKSLAWIFLITLFSIFRSVL